VAHLQAPVLLKKNQIKESLSTSGAEGERRGEIFYIKEKRGKKEKGTISRGESPRRRGRVGVKERRPSPI